MGRIKRKKLSDNYTKLRKAGIDHGETKDCTVKAFAILTGKSYSTVLEALNFAGRKSREGTFDREECRALKFLGFKLIRLNPLDVIIRYPRPHCKVLQNITTHHPRRFPTAFEHLKNERVFMQSTNHSIAMVNSVVEDWSSNHSLRILRLWIVVPI